ncbi:MAG: alpha/beta fold hydrolase [Mycobacteriales bacterium]
MLTLKDGTRLAVSEYGEGPVTLVLMHGWTLYQRNWWRQVEALRDVDGLRIVTYDHRGHGRSDPAPKGTATIAQCADDLVEVLEQFAGPVVLAGHSMGGMTIMALAERHPDVFADRVRGVAFVSTAAGSLGQLTYGLPRLLRPLVNTLEASVSRQFVRAIGRTHRIPAYAKPSLRRLMLGDRPSRQMLAEVLAPIAEVPTAVLDFRPTFDDHDRLAALAACHDIPVVVMSGTRDRLLPMAYSRRIADEIPGAELVLAPGAGHMLMVERPELVTDHLRRLVAKVASADRTA